MTELFAGLLIGLAGATHCLAMCGPLSASIALSIPRQTLLIWIALGKVSLYTLLGAFAGLIGSAVQAPLGSVLWLLSGILLLIMGLYGLGLRGPSEGLTRLIAPVVRPIQGLTRRVWPIETTTQGFIWGGLWGLLPCGLVYAALAWSLTAGDALSGALGMLGMGLGTLPAALGTGWLGHRLGLLTKTGRLAKFSGVLLILMGVYSIALAVSHN